MKKLFKRLKKNKRGFTLLECVVSLTIIGIMCGSMMALFQQGIGFISKAQKLDQSSADASQIVIMGDADVVGNDNENYYVTDLPVTIKFNIITTSVSLAPKEFNFQAGIVINNASKTKVVYYDISPDELNNLK